jgi:hypothetical protein
MKKIRREGTVRQFLVEFLEEAVSQVLGWDTPHEGKLVLTRGAVAKMHECQVSEGYLEDAFRYGQHTSKGDVVQVTRRYSGYTIGLWYKVIYTTPHPNVPSEKRYLIITCWKGVSR